MISTVPFKNISIRFKDEGQGDVVVLLHGYLENLEIWNPFAEKLSKQCRVISIDIPGHGMSGVIAETHSMWLMAQAIDSVLQQLNISRCILVGHSMGGYIALASLAEYNSRLAGICLFHSSPFADSEEKKALRMKEILFINKGKLRLICNTSIPKSFADDNIVVFSDEVERAKRIACQSQPEGVIALLKGMADRPDRQELLKKNHIPLLFILGKKDNYISFDTVYPIAQSYPCTSICVLENAGHIGFIEQPDPAIQAITGFLGKVMG